jgi:hypothetical protein
VLLLFLSWLPWDRGFTQSHQRLPKNNIHRVQDITLFKQGGNDMQTATFGWMLGVMGIMVLYAVCALIGSAKAK